MESVKVKVGIPDPKHVIMLVVTATGRGPYQMYLDRCFSFSNFGGIFRFDFAVSFRGIYPTNMSIPSMFVLLDSALAHPSA